mmetsp:Transcript_19788/g.54403  ORF Transcript_19788/g.54403 Transcript_19788/m.54403 type:complete len:216 (-) Transcript_19788:1261-1908(-)
MTRGGAAPQPTSWSANSCPGGMATAPAPVPAWLATARCRSPRHVARRGRSRGAEALLPTSGLLRCLDRRATPAALAWTAIARSTSHPPGHPLPPGTRARQDTTSLARRWPAATQATSAAAPLAMALPLPATAVVAAAHRHRWRPGSPPHRRWPGQGPLRPPRGRTRRGAAHLPTCGRWRWLAHPARATAWAASSPHQNLPSRSHPRNGVSRLANT